MDGPMGLPSPLSQSKQLAVLPFDTRPSIQPVSAMQRRMSDASLVVLPVVDAEAVQSRRRALGLDARVSALAGVEVGTLPVLDCSTLAPAE